MSDRCSLSGSVYSGCSRCRIPSTAGCPSTAAHGRRVFGRGLVIRHPSMTLFGDFAIGVGVDETTDTGGKRSVGAGYAFNRYGL